MTWANADGFQTASRDNLMMLESEGYSNADGDASLGDFKQRERDAERIAISRVFDNKDKKWNAFTTPYGYQIDAARNAYKTGFPFSTKLSLDDLKAIKDKFNQDIITWNNQKDQERSSVRATTFGGGLNKINKEEVEILRRSSKARANIEALNQLNKELDNVIKLKEEALKAEEEKKAKEAARLAAIDAAKKAESGSPVASPMGSSGTGLLGDLGGESGGSKTFMYVGIGLAVLIVGYIVLRKKN